MTLITCTRPSTIANALDEKGPGLQAYIGASLLKTVAENRDLMTRLSLTRGDTWKDFRPLYVEADKRRPSVEASDGTNVHMVVEALVQGVDISAIPEPTRSDGQAVFDAIHQLGFRVAGAEVFVVTLDGLLEPCAGTTDLILRAPDGTLFIADTKSTGAHDDGKYGALKWAVQTAIYAHGRPYTDPVQRDQWGRPKVDPAKVRQWGPGELNLERALILQVERGSATVRPFWIDIEEGWRMAKAACELRAIRKRGQSGTLLTETPEWGRV